jgi:hypothetical protein
MRRWLAPADAVLQQAAWWTAVLCAARGATAAAALAGAAAVAAHLLGRPGERARVLRAVAAAALYGLATDSVLSASGLLRFAGGGSLASPAWMVGLWAAFGAGLTASLGGILRWPAPALAVAAALAGPLAYHAGAEAGALSFGARPALATLAVAVQWALGILVLARAARAPAGERRPPAAASPEPAASAGGCR